LTRPLPSRTVSSADCRAVLTDLRARREVLIVQQEGSARTRRELAGAAIIDGDSQAQSELERHAAEAARLTYQLDDLSAAIATAQARLAEAERRETAEREVEAARQIEKIAAERVELAKLAEEALATFDSVFVEIIQRGRRLRSLAPRVAASQDHDSMALRNSQQLARCRLHKRGFLSAEAMPDERLRSSLPEIIAHLDKLARMGARKTIEGAESADAARMPTATAEPNMPKVN